MPPRSDHHSPEHEPSFSTPREAVVWYRSLGQETDVQADLPDMIRGVNLIISQGADGCLAPNRHIDPQPFLLDAACMAVELCVNSDNKQHDYGRHARSMLDQIINNRRWPVSARTDALMYRQDVDYSELMAAYQAHEITQDEYIESLSALTAESLQKFRDSIRQLSGSDQLGYSQGKFFEWFWLLSSQYLHVEGLKSSEVEPASLDRIARAAYMREDRSFVDDARVSGNHDIVYEQIIDGQRQKYHRTQLKLPEEDIDPYGAHIEVIQVSVDNLKDIMTASTLAMKKKLEGKPINPEEQKGLNLAHGLLQRSVVQY